MGQGSIYSDARGLVPKAMHDLGFTSRQIAEATDIPDRTVREIVTGVGHWANLENNPSLAEVRRNIKDKLMVASLNLSARALGQIGAKFDQTSAYQAAGIYGLLRTHERLDAGEPTQITASFTAVAIKDLDQLCEALSESLLKK